MIVQLTHLTTIPSSLRDLLADANIVKAGVAVQMDCQKLLRDYNIIVEGAQDVRPMFQQYRPPNMQLETLVKCFLGHNLPKPPHIRRSDWEQRQLSQDQIEYAATDAFAGLCLLMKGTAMMNNTDPEPVPLETSNHADNTQLDYQRVCLDAFHFMDRYMVSKLHPLYAPFLYLLRQAIFLVDQNDLDHAKNVLVKRGMPPSDVDSVSLRYLLSKGRVARKIPKVKMGCI